MTVDIAYLATSVNCYFCLFGRGVNLPDWQHCHMGKEDNRIREWRELRKITLEQLAEATELSAGYLQRMETGGRNVSLKNLRKISEALDVPEKELVPSAGEVPLVGYVGAGAAMVLFSEGDNPNERVKAPEGATKKTRACEIRGESLGSLFDHWLVYFDDVRDPPDHSMVGRLCVCGLADGRVLVKKMMAGQLPNTWRLLSNVEPPIHDVVVEWAARVKQMTPR